MENGLHSTPRAGSRAPRCRTLHPRGGRRLLAPLAGVAFAAALVAGCGATDAEESTAAPTTEEAPADGGGGDDAADEDAAAEATTDEETDDDGSESDDEGTTGAGSSGENLFEGTWGFGHDTKVLDAEELADVIEEEAEARGPEEMSLEVECGDGVDTGAGDDTAECIAYADEGVEHLWLVTVGPADAGLEVEIENAS